MVEKCLSERGTLIKIPYLQDGIQHIEAAYRVFIKGGARDVQHYIFKLQTKAARGETPTTLSSLLRFVRIECLP